MKIDGVNFIAVDVRSAERSPNEIYIRINDFKSGKQITFSKALIKSMNGKEYAEIYQAEDMSSFLLVPVKTSSDRSIYLKKSQGVVSRKSKDLLRLFDVYKRMTGKSTFVGELVANGILFRLEKKK